MPHAAQTSLPPFIAVDWGSTRFRAWRIDETGACRDSHTADAGIITITDGDFAGALRREIGGWLVSGQLVLLSGMVTSRNGWVEAPYVALPAGIEQIAERIVRRDLGDVPLAFVPGCASERDVMRGEETQILGAGLAEASFVLPGTHSKWVRVESGRIVDFRTFPSGELYHVLRHDTLIGRLAEGEGRDPAMFAAGLFRARAAHGREGLLGTLFSARAEVLLGSLAATGAADYLSGLIIGAEFAGAGALLHPSGPLVIIGGAALSERYGEAAHAFGFAAMAAPGEPARDGLVALARRIATI